MTKSRGILAPRKPWTDAEEALLREQFPTTVTRQLAELMGRRMEVVSARAKKLGLKKTPEHVALHGGWLDGVKGAATRFQPGLVPWNTGNKGIHWSPKSEFKKGNRPANWMPLGTVKLNSDGVLVRKVREGNNGGLNWEAEHRCVWADAHGEIPKMHCVVFRPGKFTTDKAAITLDVLELITRGEMASRHNYWKKDPEMARLYVLKGQITRHVNRINKEATT
jgi:hypothetical protein